MFFFTKQHPLRYYTFSKQQHPLRYCDSLSSSTYWGSVFFCSSLFSNHIKSSCYLLKHCHCYSVHRHHLLKCCASLSNFSSTITWDSLLYPAILFTEILCFIHQYSLYIECFFLHLVYPTEELVLLLSAAAAFEAQSKAMQVIFLWVSSVLQNYPLFFVQEIRPISLIFSTQKSTWRVELLEKCWFVIFCGWEVSWYCNVKYIKINVKK